MPEQPAATPPATPAAVAPVTPPPVAPPAATPPPPQTPRVDPRLPEGATAPKSTLSADIDKFFDGDEGKPVTVSPAAAPAPAAPVLPITPPPAPAPTSLAGKLASKSAPAPVAAPAGTPAAETPEATVAKIEAEMRAHNPKWKPAEGWTALKTTLKSEADARAKLEQELTATKARLASPVVAGMTAEAIADLQAREKAASDRLMVMDLENHPAFKAQFVDPKNAEITRAAELLAVHGIKVDVAALIAKPRAELGKAVAEAIKDVPEFDRVEVAEAIRKAHAIDQSSRLALANSKELGKALQTQSVERQRKAFANRWAPVSAAIGEFAQPVETPADATPEQRASDESYNRELAALRTHAEAIALQPISDEAVAESAIKAAAYDLHIRQVMPRVLSEYQQLVNLNQQLSSELRALKGRNPNHGISAVPGGGAEPVTDPNRMDHSQAAEHFFKK